MRARGLLLCLAALVFAAAVSAPVAAADDVTVRDGSGARAAPCPPIDVSDPAKPRGGCVLETASESRIEIVVRSVVGDMLFGICSYDFDMRVDGSGRTYIEAPTVGGPNPCNDMNACYHEDIRPWRGKIETDPGGRLTHVIDACFDTCMGQFAGELRLGLERTGGGWVQTADRALTGDSGYQLDGRWELSGPDLDIRPASGSVGGEAAGAWLLTGDPVGWPI